MIFFILNFILLIISFILLYKAKQIKTQRTNQINQIQQKIKEQYSILKDLQRQKDAFQILAEDKKRYLYILEEACDKLQHKLQEKQKNFFKQYQSLQQQASKSFEEYGNILEQKYLTKEQEINNKISKIQEERKQAEDKLTQVKSVYQAATAARLRQQADKTQKLFYQIQIPDTQINDIKDLQEWKRKLYDPSIVSKIIWSAFIMKPTTDLCNRVVGGANICGIYKITNQITKEIYIGQSVNISDRFKQHIKCGLGIDAPTTNKLYNNMQKYGVWNFSFEILQKCSKEKLNEKERFWIEMCQSNKVGLNVTKGNK